MNRLRNKMAALLLAIIFCATPLSASAAPSQEYAPEDYRYTEKLFDRYGNSQGIKKPTAAFRAYRWRDGIGLLDQLDSYAGNDLTMPYPVLDCYVGDTITFEDRSKTNNGSDTIIEWDWQQYGALGTHWDYYDYDILSDTVLELTEPGVTTFFLCVRSDYPIGRDSVDVWSDNGSHQTVGRNRHFPQGMYWYFTALQLNVLPRIPGQVDVKYQDAETGVYFYESTVDLGDLTDAEDQLDTVVRIPAIDGYTFDHWRVLLPDGSTQYTGTEPEAGVAVTTWAPKKVLIITFTPDPSGDGNGSTDESGGNEEEIPEPAPSPAPLPTDPPPWTDGECDGVITWTEHDSHRTISGRYPNGMPVYRECVHSFTYEASLTADASLDPDTFKSGYGFTVDVKTDIQTRLVHNTGCSSWGRNRSPRKAAAPPEQAIVYLPFTVTNRLGTQAAQIELERLLVSGDSASFQTPVNPISETGARRIYTDVTLPGTREAPVEHSVDIYISGGGVDGTAFCLQLTGADTPGSPDASPDPVQDTETGQLPEAELLPEVSGSVPEIAPSPPVTDASDPIPEMDAPPEVQDPSETDEESNHPPSDTPSDSEATEADAAEAGHDIRLLSEDSLAGSGTEADPYQISDNGQLAVLAGLTADGLTAGQWYTLTQDIHLNNAAWTPIGSTDAPFEGILDGAGHTINGLSVYSAQGQYLGLFGTVSGTVMNLTVAGAVGGRNGIGGVAGKLQDGGRIYNCHNRAMVYGKMSNIGGIVGLIQDGIVENCTNTGQIGSTPVDLQLGLGGIAGRLSGGTIRNCYNTGRIYGNNAMGGIAGGMGSDSDCIIENCYSIGHIMNITYSCGGIVGNVTSYEATASRNNYYLSGTASGGANMQDYPGMAVVMLQADMQCEAFAEILGDAFIYMPDINDGYPVLRSTLDKQFGEIRLETASVEKEYGAAPFLLDFEIIGDAEPAFESDAPDIVQVSADGEVTIYNAGTAVITITLPETEAYLPVSKTVTVRILKKTLTPTSAELPKAGELVYGQTLAESVLTIK